MRVVGLVCGLAAVTMLLPGVPLQAQEAGRIEILTPGEIFVGDPIQIRLAVDLPPDFGVVFPDWQEAWGPAEIWQVGEIDSIALADNRKTLAQTVTITLFEAGEHVLPALALPLTTNGEESLDESQSIPFEAVAIEVASLLPAGEELPEPKAPVAPIRLPLGKPFMWTAAIVALLAATLLLLQILRRRAVAGEAAERVDPLTALRRALQELVGNHDVEEVFTRTSLHLRRFLGHSLGFPAAESTTTEVRLHLRDRDLPPQLTRRAEDLLRQCDGVKFARQAVGHEEAEAGVKEAGAIGSDIVTALAPPPEQPPEQPGGDL